jgi:hypothetical protein
MRRRDSAYRAAAVVAAVNRVCVRSCSKTPSKSSCGAAKARIGESIALSRRNISVAALRSNGEFAPADVDAALWVTRD